LAFSAGIDSSALFFILLEYEIPFDIAIVEYGVRAEGREETLHAKLLAKQYGLQCYTAKAPLFQTHFEQQARDFRYTFFEKIIKEHSYDTLLTAHQLNDQIEWLLMRLSKGAGTSELLGMDPITQREDYTLVRPLLAYSKEELLDYLTAHKYPYFIDKSNQDETYERNRFRKQFADPLIQAHAAGIKRSLHYLRRDKIRLEEGFETVMQTKHLRIIRLHKPHAKAKAADIALKALGYLLSAAQRTEIEKESTLVIGGKWAISQYASLLYIAPYCNTKMPKSFKEQCRTLDIPAKIRPYLFREEIDPCSLVSDL